MQVVRDRTSNINLDRIDVSPSKKSLEESDINNGKNDEKSGECRIVCVCRKKGQD
jgi:hypothetical protein